MLESNFKFRIKKCESRRYHNCDEQHSDWLFMSVADSDFRLAKPIRDDLIKKVLEGNLVYCYYHDQLHKSIAHWYSKQYDTCIKQANIIHGNGVMHLIQVAIETFSKEGQGVIIQPPVYDPFMEVIKLKNRRIINNPLIYDQDKHYYTMDFELLEKQFQDDNNKILLLCSPHNPVGRVWKKAELERLIELSRKYGIIILSDEIWQDIVFTSFKHIPIFMLEPNDTVNNTIVISSQAKTYNLGGMQYGYAIIKNKALYEKMNQVLKSQIHYASHHVLNCTALISGYCRDESYAWYQEFLRQVEKNYEYIKTKLTKYTNIKLTNCEGTYLIWLDLSYYCKTKEEVREKMNQAKIQANEGYIYGEEYDLFVRINIGTNFKNIEDLVRRLVRVFK